MPGGVGGKAREGLPIPISLFLSISWRCSNTSIISASRVGNAPPMTVLNAALSGPQFMLVIIPDLTLSEN